MMKARRSDRATRLSRTVGLAVIAMAVAILTANCNGVKPDPNSFDFVNSRGDP